MNRIDEIKLGIRQLDAEIAERSREKARLKDEMANLVCPFKLGQLITYKHGRTRVKAVVDDIHTGRYGSLGEYDLTVIRVRADGSMGAAVHIQPWLHKPEAVAP